MVDLSTTLNRWICDCCSGYIENERLGALEWLESCGTNKTRGLRIVHDSSRCGYDEVVEYERDRSLLYDYNLACLVGEQRNNGMLTLLRLIENNELELKSAIEIMRRLYVPGYEFARKYFAKAVEAQVIERDIAFKNCTYNAIRSTLDWMGKL